MTRLLPALILGLTVSLPAQNLLTNPGFETGDFTGWTIFGNVFNEFTVPPQFVPHNGSNNLCSTFGNFSGSFNATGLFQTFPATEGDVFQMLNRSNELIDPQTGENLGVIAVEAGRARVASVQNKVSVAQLIESPGVQIGDRCLLLRGSS